MGRPYDRPVRPLSPQILAEKFEEWTGWHPEGVWRAPGRANLIGEHLDYNGGHVLPFAVDRAAWVAVRRIAPAELRLRSVQYGPVAAVPLADLERAQGWPAYLAGAVWALGESGVAPVGAEILLDSEIPQGSGLSSSAAVVCATALAVADLAGLDTTSAAARTALVLAAQRAETQVAGVPVGTMDQAASFLCVDGHAMYLDCRDLGFSQLPLPLGAGGYRLLAVDSGTSHDLAAGEYAERRRACEAVAMALGVEHLAHADRRALDAALEAEVGPEALRRARHVVSEEGRVREVARLLAAGRLDGVGPLMTESHRSLQRDFDNSTARLDAIVDAALAAGAAGARLTGAGWGGTVVMLVEASRAVQVATAVREVLAPHGAQEPVVWDLAPSAGASRVA